MAVYKMTMIFVEDENGWTETWYWGNGPSSLSGGSLIVVGPVQPGTNPALVNWFAACQARVNMLPKSGILRALRVADVSSPRSAYLDESVALMSPSPQVERDLKRRALIATAHAGEANGYRRSVNLRGIPDVYADFNDRGQSNFEFVNDLFVRFKQTLLEAGACLRVLRKNLSGTPNPPRLITKIEAIDPGPDVVITTATPHGLTSGQTVRISKVRTLDADVAPPFNGVFDVETYAFSAHDPTLSFRIPFVWQASYAGFKYVGGGQEQLRVYDFPVLKTLKQDRWGSHRVGAPFGVGRGRSRPRTKRASIPAVSALITFGGPGFLT